MYVAACDVATPPNSAVTEREFDSTPVPTRSHSRSHAAVARLVRLAASIALAVGIAGYTASARADEVPLPSGQVNPVAQHFGSGYNFVGATGDVSRTDWYGIDSDGFLGVFQGMDPVPSFIQTPYNATSITFSPDGSQLVIGTEDELYFGRLVDGAWVQDSTVLLDTFGLQSLDLYGGNIMGSFQDEIRRINLDGSTVFVDNHEPHPLDYHEFPAGMYDHDIAQSARWFSNVNSDGAPLAFNRQVDFYPTTFFNGTAAFSDGQGGHGMGTVYSFGSWVYDDSDLTFLGDMKSSLVPEPGTHRTCNRPAKSLSHNRC